MPRPRPRRRASAGSTSGRRPTRRRSRSSAGSAATRRRARGRSEAQEYLPPVEEAGDREAEADAEHGHHEAAEPGPQPVQGRLHAPADEPPGEGPELDDVAEHVDRERVGPDPDERRRPRPDLPD